MPFDATRPPSADYGLAELLAMAARYGSPSNYDPSLPVDPSLHVPWQDVRRQDQLMQPPSPGPAFRHGGDTFDSMQAMAPRPDLVEAIMRNQGAMNTLREIPAGAYTRSPMWRGR